MPPRRRRHRTSSPAASTGTTLKRPILYAVASLGLLGAVAAGVLYMTNSQSEDQLPQAVALLDKGDYRGAELALKNTLQDNPGNAEARYRLGYVLYKMERFPAAEKEIRAAIEKGARYPDLPALLGSTLLRLGQADNLLKDVTPAADAPAGVRAEILVLRAKALLLKGQRPEAEQALADAERAAPGHAQVLAARAQLRFAAGQQDQALALMDQALAADAKQAGLWNTKGDLLRLLKRGQEAHAAYAKASALEPQSVAPRLASISLLLEDNKLDQAASELKQAKQIAAGQLMLLYLEAQLDLRQGRHIAAKDNLLQVLKAAPDYPPAQRLAGLVFLMTGQRETAINHLTRYLEHAPKDDGARKLLATAMLETGQIERARQVIDEISEVTRDDTLLATLRGDIALRSGNLAEAQQHLSQAVSQSPDNPELLLQLAGRLLSSGDERGAQAALEKVTALDPANEKAAVMLTMLNVKAKRYDQALKTIDALAKAHPKGPMAPNLSGAVELARGQNDAARRHFEVALKLDPAYLPAVANLAKLDLLGKDHKSARQRYEVLLRQTPNHAKALLALAELDLLERNEKAFVEHIERAKRADPKDPAPRVLATRYWLDRRDTGKALDEARAGLDATDAPLFFELLGTIHLTRGDKREAVSTYTKWRDSDPQNPQAHYRLALAQHGAGDRPGAGGSLDKALAINPSHGEATLAKVRLLIENGKHQEALSLSQAFQKRQPRSPLGLEAEARTRAAQGQHADAAGLWERAARLADQGPYAVQAFAAHKQAGQAAKGDAWLTTWLNQHPRDLVARHTLAQSQIERGLNREAIANYELLLQHAPRDMAALNNLATLYGRIGDKRALATAERALDVSPGNPLVLDTYGWLLSEAGQAKAGLPHLQKALAGQSDNPEIRWHLSVTLQRAGDARGAMTELDRLLSSRTAFPQQVEARKLLDQLRAANR